MANETEEQAVMLGLDRTKDAILQICDAPAEDTRTGAAYATRLSPRPGPPADAAGNFIPMDQWTEWPAHIRRQSSVDQKKVADE